MRPRDQPSGRTGSMEEPLEEPIVINMSMDGPEEAGANARSPSPEYENLDVAEVIMDVAEAEEDKSKNKSPESKAPGSRSPSRDPRERSPVLNASYTQNFRPRQAYRFPTVTQVTEGRNRSGEEEAKERQDSGAQGDMGRKWSQVPICDCKICQTMPGRGM